jgi:hypothetical protein
MFYILLLLIEIIVLYFLSRMVVRSVYHFFHQVTRRKSLGMYLFAILFLPGTFIHEISHFMAALFLLVPVGKLELIPKFKEEGGGVDLGSVAIAKTDPVRRFLIGVAPFIFGIVIIFTILYLVSTGKFIEIWWGKILAGILIFEIANSMFASKKDLEGAVVLFAFLIVIAIFVSLLIYFFGISIHIDISGFRLGRSTQEILRNANLFLLVPIVIDSMVLILFKRLRF